MIILGVYEDNEYQECVFVGTYKEVAKEFNMNYRNVIKTVCKKQKIQGKKGKRYLIYKLYDE